MRAGFTRACALVLAVFFLLAGPAAAHHPGHGGGGGTGLFNPFSTLSRPPRTFVNLTFGFDSLDGNLGEVYTTQVSGEYALHRRFSLGARLPVTVVRGRFVQAEGLGDAALTIKGLAWESPKDRLFLSLGLDTAFPTGRESKGLGAGDVVFSPYATVSKGFERVDLFGTLGTSVAAAADARPSLDFALGANVPILKQGVGFDAFLAFQGSTTFANQVLTSGSTKAYLKPGVTIRPIEPLRISVGGKISVLDTLEVKPGETLPPTSPVLLTDVVYGFLFDLNYSF
jgi:hypothetical protein